MLELMYITNQKEVAKIADESGVDRIWIDLETRGKEERQKNLDTVKSQHKISDIGKVKSVLKNSKLMVRVNPLNKASKKEIDNVINEGADIVMLPFFETIEEVKKFIEMVNKRAKVSLLCETIEAVKNIDEILQIPGIDEIHIGLNDLHLQYGNKFMFELLSNGTVENICQKIKKAKIPYGFGGVARVGTGTLPAEDIIIEHYRLGSTRVILSRSFCNTQIIKNKAEIKKLFTTGVKDIRNIEKKAENYTKDQFEKNKEKVKKEVTQIIENIES